MNRFIHLDNGIQDMYINVRAIFGVTQEENGRICIELADGTTYMADQTLLPEITGDNAITDIITIDQEILRQSGPDIRWRELGTPSYLAVMASGKLRPLDSNYRFLDTADKCIPGWLTTSPWLRRMYERKL